MGNKKIKSIRIKLFLTLCITLIVTIAILIIANSFVLEKFYIYSKEKTLLNTYNIINTAFSNGYNINDIENQLEKISIYNNFDILIKNEGNINIYSSNRDFLSNFIIDYRYSQPRTFKSDTIYSNKNIEITRSNDFKNGLTYIFMTAGLDNGYILYIRMPIASIQESVKISNNFLYWIGGITIAISGVMVLIISKKFTKPITELSEIANKMAKLDFSHKYNITTANDEINNLGKSINTMSDKLEQTIKQLRNTNIELEKDIEEKSKTDEMRKQFISDVSHELKTPIALIQGYAEGLVENVVEDAESRKFYAEVILDESNKMDKLVKQLLELMKLEYGKREFNNNEFNISELINEVIRKSKVMLEEKQVKVTFDNQKIVKVYADEFYIEQVITNYLTNAIKHVKEKKGVKEIVIKAQDLTEKIRISVFNTGNNIEEENINRIWNRFYKVDVSRNREDGGTGIGLSLVRAIMNNYNNKYGVNNLENGVEFYFELDKK